MNKRGIYSLVLIGFLMISLMSGFVGAEKYTMKSVDGELIVTQVGGSEGKFADFIDTSTWYGSMLDFFGFRGNWTFVVVQIIVAMIIAAALYDILGLTAFESKAVKFLISIGVALITSMVGGIMALAAVAFSIAGGVAAIGVSLVIIMAVVAFVLIHFGTSTLAQRMIRAKGGIRAAQAGATAEEATEFMRGITRRTRQGR